MLLWFSLDMSKRIRALEKSTDRQAKSNLLQIIALGQLDGTVRDQAEALLRELEEKKDQE